jgi:hypothetical protein
MASTNMGSTDLALFLALVLALVLALGLGQVAGNPPIRTVKSARCIERW